MPRANSLTPSARLSRELPQTSVPSPSAPAILAPDTANLSANLSSFDSLCSLAARITGLPAQQREEIAAALDDAEARAAGRRDALRYDVLAFVEGDLADDGSDGANERIGSDLNVPSELIASYQCAVDNLMAAVLRNRSKRQ